MQIHKIPGQIIKGKLTLLDLGKVDKIVLHHMAHPSADVKTVEGWHIGKGWAAIGYNYWIGFDGVIYEGRGLHAGAHVAGHNSNSIGIGFQGNYQEGAGLAVSAMTDAQLQSGAELIGWLRAKVPSVKRVVGHRDLEANACPGNMFPFARIAAGEKKEETEGAEMIYNYIDSNMPAWARPTIQKLVDRGALEGNEKGELDLNDTMLRILVIHDRMGLYD